MPFGAGFFVCLTLVARPGDDGREAREICHDRRLDRDCHWCRHGACPRAFRSLDKARIRKVSNEANDRIYLYAVNSTPENVACQFTVSEFPDRSLRVISEARSVRSDDRGMFADDFAPYAVHLYTTDPEAGAGLKTLAEVSTLIREAGGNP